MKLCHSSHQEGSPSDSEVSLVDILHFLRGAYKIIAITGAIGLIVAIAYLTTAPKQYEAIAQIAVAQISTNNYINNPLGINIEEPSLLISRLSLPSSFPPQVLDICGIDEGVNSAVTLSKFIKFTSLKGVANVIELKTFGKTPEAAAACAQSIFDLIKNTQAQIVAPINANIKIKLENDIERLAKAKELLTKVDKSGSAIGAAYLSTRDEIRFLLEEITALKDMIVSNQNRATRLIAPVYVSDTPIAPKKRLVLALGVLGGLFLGLVLTLGFQMLTKFKLVAQ